jgi:hypothetical protein
MHVPAFLLRLPEGDCLRIVGEAGYTVRIDEGEVWITVDGQHRDVIARAGERLALDPESRALLSSFRDAAVVVSAPCGSDDVGFLLQDLDGLRGLRVLTVTAPGAEALAPLGHWLIRSGTPATRRAQAGRQIA